MADPRPGLMTVVGEALERADAAERAAYLDRACGTDAALRQRVEALLVAHAGAGRFLEPGVQSYWPRDATVAVAPGAAAGPFARTNPEADAATGGSRPVVIRREPAPSSRAGTRWWR